MGPPLPLRFVTSASAVADLPPTDAELAIVGRSNVGKSSLVNALANQRQLARVSKTPGRTQLLNLFAVDDGSATIVDLPGYGYAKVPEPVRARWGPMIERYLTQRDGLRGVIVLIDAEVGPTPLDVAMLAWLRDLGPRIHVVATKHDKVKPSRRERRKRELAEGCGVPVPEVVWVSASSGVNIDVLRVRIRDWLTT